MYYGNIICNTVVISDIPCAVFKCIFVWHLHINEFKGLSACLVYSCLFYPVKWNWRDTLVCCNIRNVIIDSSIKAAYTFNSVRQTVLSLLSLTKHKTRISWPSTGHLKFMMGKCREEKRNVPEPQCNLRSF